MERAVKAACVQAEPVVLDRDATLEKLERLTAEAAGEGAELVVFPEAFIPVYPSSTWAKHFAGWADERSKAAFARIAEEAVAVPGPAADRLGATAKAHGVWLVTGVTEIDPERPGTLYNTLLYHGPDGSLALKHRKLVPTNHERLVWGPGDGSGLRAIQTGVGRIGGLICWENYMPLARFALYGPGSRSTSPRRPTTATPGRRPSFTSPGRLARSSSRRAISSAPPPTRPTFRSETRSRGMTYSAAEAAQSSGRTARTSLGRSTTRRGSSMPTSSRRASSRNDNALIQPATITAPTSSA